jgi:hypothetical protein
MPDFSKLTQLVLNWIPDCGPELLDCALLSKWLPAIYDSYTCCQEDEVICEDDRIVILDLASETTGITLTGDW